MKIKCDICNKETDVNISNIETVIYEDFVTQQKELMICMKYQTFCRHCGEYVFGVKRKILKQNQIEKLFEDKNY